MSAALLTANILTWSLRIGALAVLAGAVSAVLKLPPKIRLFYLQLALAACLLSPAVGSWKRPQSGGGVVTVTSTRVVRRSPKPGFPFTRAQSILFVLAAGALIRAAFLGMGLWRLRGYRVHSRPLSSPNPWSKDADLRVSSEVPGPVTFGFVHPVVLLPEGFETLDPNVREAILCHEILHIRRNDWLFTIAEELVRTVLWFHPAIWWLLSEIQLAREQTVDLEAIAMTACRDSYVDALLSAGAGTPAFGLASAPSFLRRRHLKRRVFSILKEVKMSKKKLWSGLALATAVLCASLWVVSGTLPLEAAPQTPATGAPVSVRYIQVTGISGAQSADLVNRLAESGIREGQQQASAESLTNTTQAVLQRNSLPGLIVKLRSAGADQFDLVIGPPASVRVSDPNLLRIGANVQEANILQKVTPDYPPLAKMARVQGIVRLDVVIGKDGTVQDIQFISGPPLLINAATQAVQHWVYRPTLLNGNPVEVVTTVDVNFTLSQ